MSDSDVQLQPDGTGKLVDTSSVTTGAGTVQRQRVALADPGTGAALAGVVNGSPAASDYGLETRPLNFNWCKQVNLNPGNTAPGAGVTFNSAPAIDLGDLSSAGASYSKFRVLINSDQPGTLNLQQSPDTTTWFTTFPTAVIASTPLIVESLIVLRYLRIQYVNGPSATSAFTVRAVLVAI